MLFWEIKIQKSSKTPLQKDDNRFVLRMVYHKVYICGLSFGDELAFLWVLFMRSYYSDELKMISFHHEMQLNELEILSCFKLLKNEQKQKYPSKNNHSPQKNKNKQKTKTQEAGKQKNIQGLRVIQGHRVIFELTKPFP